MDSLKAAGAVWVSLAVGVFCLLQILPASWKRMIFSMYSLLKLLITVRLHAKFKGGRYYSAVDEFEAQADANPNRVQMIVAEDSREVTLHEMDTLANRVAHWTEDLGLTTGDSIALMLLNRPEFVSFWMGAAKRCVATALINTNATGAALLHSVKLATATCKGDKVLVVDAELHYAIAQDDTVTRGLKEHGVKVHIWQTLAAIGGDVSNCSSLRPSRELRQRTCKENDPLLYIFTSGTTGLPKASKISHSRWFIGSLPLGQFCQLSDKDRLYCPLPLYHSAAGMMGVGAAIRTGATLVIRRKFSVSKFSADCIMHRITAMQYIGELCRYLANAPPNALDESVRIESAFGNGICRDVWEKFQQRYHVKHIVEFYASTEGNLALFNSTDKVGALGFVPRIVDFLYPVKLVLSEPDNPGVPLRDSKGRCVLSAPNEVGLMIGEINSARVDRRFDGYTDAAATSSKVLRDVLAPGDSFFNTGDLLSRDSWGFFYWSDRIGDTFRWKGENASTAEVAAVVTAVKGVRECCVYGVAVPRCDGKCGMASIVLDNGVDPGTFTPALHKEMKAHLPSFARPLFLRFLADIPKTTTFKHKKGELAKAGFDPRAAEADGGGSIFYMNPKRDCYLPMTTDAFDGAAGAINY